MTDKSTFETPTEGYARTRSESKAIALLMGICRALLFVAILFAPFAWILRDGLGPDSINSTGMDAAQKMFWCFYRGPATVVFALATALLGVKALLARKTAD